MYFVCFHWSSLQQQVVNVTQNYIEVKQSICIVTVALPYSYGLMIQLFESLFIHRNNIDRRVNDKKQNQVWQRFYQQRKTKSLWNTSVCWLLLRNNGPWKPKLSHSRRKTKGPHALYLWKRWVTWKSITDGPLCDPDDEKKDIFRKRKGKGRINSKHLEVSSKCRATSKNRCTSQ